MEIDELLCDYPPFMTVSQTAEILGISEQTVRGLIKEEKLVGKKAGNRYRIPKSCVIGFLNGKS